jgi:orotidine-5'-phosphate decarboxylase
MKIIEKIENRIKSSNSRVCVGLDLDIEKIPPHLPKNMDGLFEFAKEIIHSTKDHVLAYKPNLAFFEVFGSKGFELLEKILKEIPNDIITIADAKRGDIGNTANMYAKTFFETFGFDIITVNPYMGYDSISPYLNYEDKGTIVLGLTSNKGSEDFQEILVDERSFAEIVSEKVEKWNVKNNLMLVVGATNGEKIEKIRNIAKDLYFLVPGIGAQGGSLHEVIKYSGKNVIVNSSRGIIYASQKKDFAEISKQKTIELKNAINHEIALLK